VKLRFCAATFLVVFCCVYIFSFAMDWPLFRYYPLHGEVTWGRQVLQGRGPAMAWYGLMANGAVAGMLLAMLVPHRAVDRLFRNYYFVFPSLAMLACVFLLRHFFA
jgi:hypothetical protein